MIGHGLEQIDAVLRPFGGEVSALTRAQIDNPRARFELERGEGARLAHGDGEFPVFPGDIEPLRRQGAIEDALAPLRRFLARLIGVGDHGQTLVARLDRQMVIQDQGLRPQKIEQGLQPLVEQRQIMLHPALAPALADRRIEGIIPRRAKGLDEA